MPADIRTRRLIVTLPDVNVEAVDSLIDAIELHGASVEHENDEERELLAEARKTIEQNAGFHDKGVKHLAACNAILRRDLQNAIAGRLAANEELLAARSRSAADEAEGRA